MALKSYLLLGGPCHFLECAKAQRIDMKNLFSQLMEITRWLVFHNKYLWKEERKIEQRMSGGPPGETTCPRTPDKSHTGTEECLKGIPCDMSRFHPRKKRSLIYQMPNLANTSEHCSSQVTLYSIKRVAVHTVKSIV